ncbi:unnamed protein product [Caenorhabditis nigoni]
MRTSSIFRQHGILILVISALLFPISSCREENREHDCSDVSKPHTMKFTSPGQNMAQGAAAGAAYNAANYAIKSGGRASNILNIYDKTQTSSLGNPKWFARIDAPHGNVPFHHINVNKAITGVKDPHIQISGATARAAGATGQVLNAVNKAAPVIMAASVLYDVVDVVNTDKKDVPKKIVNIVATKAGGYYGATAGAAYGTMIFPGVGTLIGGIVGGIFGGVGGGLAGDVVNEIFRN